MRRKKAPAAENHERWLVSYADFITLLFAFFVVMFASSQRDSNKAKQMSESVREAMESGGLAVIRDMLGSLQNPPARKAPEPEAAKQPGELAPSLAYLNRELKEAIEAGKIRVSLQERGLVVSLREAAFFRSGDDRLFEDTYPTMEKIATVLRDLTNPVRLEGHTDSVPIHNSRFRSNWELSSARSIAVLELFRTRFGIPSPRFAVAGYAENLPVDSNGTEEGRARNRRVDVVILSRKALMNDDAAPPAENAAAAANGKQSAHANGQPKGGGH